MATESLSSEFRDGTYKCAKCGEILYLSGDKFQSIDKYPAFRKSAEPNSVKYVTGDFGTDDIECNKCGNHIGQLFHDGKKSGDKHPDAKDRHCVESASLTFEASNPDQEAPVLEAPVAQLTLNVTESTEKPSTSPLGTVHAPTPQTKTNLRASAQNRTAAATSKPTRTRTPQPTSELVEEATGPSKTLMGVVAVAAVAIIGIGGYLGWRRMANNKK